MPRKKSNRKKLKRKNIGKGGAKHFFLDLRKKN